jgi:hypothetical protein
MLYREIIAVCSQIHTKHVNTMCGQNVELNTTSLTFSNSLFYQHSVRVFCVDLRTNCDFFSHTSLTDWFL